MLIIDAFNLLKMIDVNNQWLEMIKTAVTNVYSIQQIDN